MSKNPQTYFVSDTHFSHKNILKFERSKDFETIYEHDNYISRLFAEWAEKWLPGSTLYFLGDFGNPDYLWVFNLLRDKGIIVNFLYGNHDQRDNLYELDKYVDNIFYYPIYLNHRLVISHFPVAAYEDTICVHGHLHGAKLSLPNYVCASIAVNNYQPISLQYVNGIYSKLPKFDRRFLYEPYAEYHQFTQPKEDCIYDKSGRIDLSASRLFLKMKENKNDF